MDNEIYIYWRRPKLQEYDIFALALDSNDFIRFYFLVGVKNMKPERLTQLAKEAGFVQGPWANGNKERIWQENRDFPDALEVFASLIAKECVKVITDQTSIQTKLGIYSNIHGLNQAIFSIEEEFGLDTKPESV